jgi:hypothetical protein
MRSYRIAAVRHLANLLGVGSLRTPTSLQTRRQIRSVK